jgi:NifU-like protein involved in Fe-S cluster formation
LSEGDFPLPGEVGEQFLSLARCPKNIGWLANPSGQGAAAGKCGDAIEVSLRIDQGANADINVLPHGCLYTLGEALADYNRRTVVAGSRGAAA